MSEIKKKTSKKTVGDMETFQRYLTSINKQNVAVFDLRVSSPDLYG